MASVYYERDQEAQEQREPYGVDPNAAPTMSIGPLLRNLLATAWRNLWLIVTIVALMLLGSLAITLFTTPKYTAKSSVEISNQSEQVLGEDFDQKTEQADSWDLDRFLNTQLTILRSRSLADRVARKLNLYTDKRYFASVNLDPEKYKSTEELREAVLISLMRTLEVELPSLSSIAEIKFTTTDAQISARIANTYAEEFIRSNLQRKFDSSSYARNFVREQLAAARAQLEQSEQQLNTYARQANLIRTRDPSAVATGASVPSTSVTAASLLQLNEAANDATAARAQAQARWNAERSQPLLSSPAALSSDLVQELGKRKSEIQASLENAQTRYLSDHPSVSRLQSDLKNIDAQLTRAATQARDSVRAAYVAAEASEKSLKGQVKQLEGATLQEQDRSVRYNTLAREADTNRSIYEGLLQRYRELNASAGITASNISIVDNAEPPVDPSSPRPLLNAFVGLLLGVVVAAVAVFLRDQLDDRIRIPEEVEQKIGLKLLGVVPQTRDEDPVEALDDPKSVISESYNALRSSLFYSTRDGLPQVILVTSAQPSEGKSTSSFALARSLAQVGKRTLLIDADLRRPSIHRIAGLTNKNGLSSVLVGESKTEEATVPGVTPNLSIMTSGPLPPSPAELLTSPRLVEMLRNLRETYDSVIIDSAPVLGLADSPGLSALVDGVLLVVEANRGGGGQLNVAVRRLRVMKPLILGVVLTKFNPKMAGNAYTSYYQYNYYTYRADETT